MVDNGLAITGMCFLAVKLTSQHFWGPKGCSDSQIYKVEGSGSLP